MPLPETLRAIREYLAEHHREFRRIAGTPAVLRLLGSLHGEQLSRVPKGFAKDHPAEDLLRFKMFLLYVELPAQLATTPELYTEVQRRFRALAPLVNFLNSPLARSAKKFETKDFLV